MWPPIVKRRPRMLRSPHAWKLFLTRKGNFNEVERTKWTEVGSPRNPRINGFMLADIFARHQPSASRDGRDDARWTRSDTSHDTR